jgi:hypothetical protein
VSINNSDEIVGAYTPVAEWQTPNSYSISFLYSNGTFTDITPPQAVRTIARHINDSGQIVGDYYTSPFANDFHAFLYSGGTYITLNDPLAGPTPQGGTGGTSVTGINDQGQVVGQYVGPSGTHYFIYQNGTYSDIVGGLPSEFSPDFARVVGINDSGQIIGVNSFTGESFLATIVAVNAPPLVGGPGNDTLLSSHAFSLSPAEGSIYRLYGATLGRAPDVGGLQYWAGLLASGQRSLTGITTDFINSPEFQSNYGTLDNTHFITLLYNNVLHRSPDATGQTYWVGQLDAGASRASVVDGFSESDEYRAETAIAASAFATTDLHGGTYGSIFRLYGATLDRQPDEAGFQHWVGALAGGQSLESITTGFINSAEFRSNYGTLDNTQFVSLLYNNVLHRPADATGQGFWVGRLNGGASRESVVDGFSESAEYQSDTAAALNTFVQTSVPSWSDFLYSAGGNNTLLGGPGADTFRFDLNTPGTDDVYGLQSWDTLNLVNFGYSSAANAIGHMTQAGPDVLFADRGENITFHDTTLAAISGVSYRFT